MLLHCFIYGFIRIGVTVFCRSSREERLVKKEFEEITTEAFSPARAIRDSGGEYENGSEKIIKSEPADSGDTPTLNAVSYSCLMEIDGQDFLENKRRTLKKNDFTAAIRQTEIFDFLVDVVPRDEINEQANGFGPGMVGSSVSAVPNYYPLMGQPAMPGVMIGRPAVPVVAPSVYVQPSLQAWQAPEDNSYAGGWNSGLGNLDRQS
ncbi:nuclear transcription factor Y subunit C-1-like isoform X4 [Solanum dulcamara]|uniref:nuclear transcription factor Y subunit C-1-like isoform X4 n=1 Tax=Solanum dulcamara TaxID=45834 RepID=UPI0024869B04|nr:nuclear transcription factor Y subunit C-1-like isoform X4 [Solanum dulcamara]